MKFLNLLSGCALIWFKAFVIAALFNWHVAALIGANHIDVYPMVIILFLLALGTTDPYVKRENLEDDAAVFHTNVSMAIWVSIVYIVGYLLTLLH